MVNLSLAVNLMPSISNVNIYRMDIYHRDKVLHSIIKNNAITLVPKYQPSDPHCAYENI